MKHLLFTLALITLTLSGVRAHAHARLVNPVPRTTNSGITVGPCDSPTPATPMAFQAGSTITISFEETIHHAGSFQLFFSSGSSAGLSLGAAPGTTKLFDVPQTFANSVGLPHQYTQTVTLPNTTCTDCQLQLVQVDTDVAASTTYYFSCADIALTSSVPAPAPIPIPAPAPDPTCASHTGTGTTSPTGGGGTTPPVVGTFTAINTSIIQPLCISCHTGAAAAGGYNFSTYGGVMAAVTTANPTQSLLYTTTSDGAMPEGGSHLTSTQEQLILSWIQAGAKNN